MTLDTWLYWSAFPFVVGVAVAYGFDMNAWWGEKADSHLWEKTPVWLKVAYCTCIALMVVSSLLFIIGMCVALSGDHNDALTAFGGVAGFEIYVVGGLALSVSSRARLQRKKEAKKEAKKPKEEYPKEEYPFYEQEMRAYRPEKRIE